MAYWRNLTTTRARVRVLAQRFAPAFSYFHHEDYSSLQSRSFGNNNNNSHSFLQSRSFGNNNYNSHSFLQSRSFGNNNYNSQGFGVSFRDPRWSQFPYASTTTTGFLLARNISTGTREFYDLMSDLADRVGKGIADTDRFPLVAAIQHAIDGIHSFTGLNWWASIAIMTLVIRVLSIPWIINGRRLNSKKRVMTHKLDQIDIDPGLDIFERNERSLRVLKEYDSEEEEDTGLMRKVCLTGYYVLYFSHVFAVLNMARKVPSFKTGGVSWFIDLTTVDSLCVLPILNALSLWILLRYTVPDLRSKEPLVYLALTYLGAYVALTIPVTACCFPKALLCHYLTSNWFLIAFRLFSLNPSVEKFLNIPHVPPPPPQLPPPMKKKQEDRG